MSYNTKMNFNDIKELIIKNATVNGEYKSGKMNGKACAELKVQIDAFVIPGFETRADKIFAFLHGLEEAPKCVCGAFVRINSNGKLQAFCSPKCSATSASTKEKREVTNTDRYGGGAPMCDPDVLARTQATNLQRYGAPSSWAGAEIREKAAQTNLQRYGVENPAKSEEVQKKISTTHQAHTPERREEKRVKTAQTRALKRVHG